MRGGAPRANAAKTFVGKSGRTIRERRKRQRKGLDNIRAAWKAEAIEENTPAGRLAKICRAGQFKRWLEMGNERSSGVEFSERQRPRQSLRTTASQAVAARSFKPCRLLICWLACA